ncbi:MAG: putative zinc-binding metallopeptidase [Steroidobacteraceae bacterium]
MPAARSSTRRHAWTRLPDDELLKLRFRDLKLTLRGSALERRLKRIYTELEKRGIQFKPHMWLAEEWFSPDGVPGIAVPFYLAHPRLEKLERQMMKQVEGGNANWLMRILRHEAGHAVDSAYRLRRRSAWRDVFGPASLPYPDRYKARPGSRRYVHHLGEWYAQSHPTEDFAETFAVWLKPNSDWRRSYQSWPAYHKLQFVEELMAEVRGVTPSVRGRAHIEPLGDNARTLGDHYRLKLARYRKYRASAADQLLLRVFVTHAQIKTKTKARAGTLLRGSRREIVVAVARETGVDHYSVYQILRLTIERAERLKLCVRGSRRETLRNVRWMLARLVRLYGQSATPHLTL